MADEDRIKKCCPPMEEAVKEELIYLTEDGKFFLCIDFAYVGFEFVKYCPWCGELIRKEEG